MKMEKQEFNYDRLRSKIRASGYTLSTLADKIGCTEGTLCNKLHQKYDFTQIEMFTICKALGISLFDVGLYFFAI